MRIFALETDEQKLRSRLVSQGEDVVMSIYYHPFLFIVRFVKFFFQTLILVALGAGAQYIGIPGLETWLILAGVWLFWPALKLLTAYVDWQYDTLLVTSEKVIIVNQSSIFHLEIKQMNLDNIASVSAQTQMWNIFPFGMVCFDLKEGTGQRTCLAFIPHAEEVAIRAADVVVQYQRKRHTQPPPPPLPDQA